MYARHEKKLGEGGKLYEPYNYGYMIWMIWMVRKFYLTHIIVVENKFFNIPPLKKTQRHMYINEQPRLNRGGCVFLSH